MFNLKVALSVVSNRFNKTINNKGSNSQYFKESAPIYKRMIVFAENILLAKTIGQRLELINEQLLLTDKPKYIQALNKLKSLLLTNFIDDKRIFQKGNSKLPFLKYGTLPLINCGGKGDCSFYCYSPKSWRKYTPFVRQLINTIIEREHFHLIEKQLTKLLTPKKDKPIVETFRLYVDGDFSSIELYKQWMILISRFPLTRFYGYSKSLNFFNQMPDIVPSNYKLNISNGGIFDNMPIADKLLTMPIVRGRFDAIKADNKKVALAILRERYPNNKVFMCPGKCGNCTPIGHACGSDRFKNVVIGILVH